MTQQTFRQTIFLCFSDFFFFSFFIDNFLNEFSKKCWVTTLVRSMTFIGSLNRFKLKETSHFLNIFWRSQLNINFGRYSDLYSKQLLKRKIIFQLSQTNNSSQIITLSESNMSAKLPLLWRKHTNKELIISINIPMCFDISSE